MISIRNQYCNNQHCKHYQERLAGNILIHSQKTQRLKCKTCGKTWVTRSNSVMYRLKHDQERIETAKILIESGSSIRETAKMIKVSPSTIQRWKKRLK